MLTTIRKRRLITTTPQQTNVSFILRPTGATWHLLLFGTFIMMLPSSLLSSSELSRIASSSSLSSSSATTTTCSICPNPNNSISLPNATIPIFGTCADLAAAIGFIPANSDTCTLIQSVSSLCGCPVSKSSCFLCDHNYNGPINASRPVPYLLDVPGINVTCDIVQAYLHSISYQNDTCTLTKALVGPYCGCPTESSVGTSSGSSSGSGCSLCTYGQAVANRTIESGLNLPFLKTCGDLENVAQTYWQEGSTTCQAVKSIGPYCGCSSTTTTVANSGIPHCTLCSNGNPATLVNHTLPFLKDTFNLAGLDPTCGLVDAAIQSISSTDPLCASVRLLSTDCGCAPIPDHCVYCPKPGDHVTKPNLVVKQFSDLSGGLDLTCAEITSTQYQVPCTSDICWKGQSKNFICGCNFGQFDYLGADTIAKKRGLAWMPRLSAMLSVLGSLYILIDVYRFHRSPLDQYHELVASISFFALIGSVAAAFTTLPIPAYDKYGQPSGIYGAHGSVGACKAQGFFFQLGLTGIFYNFALSIYYVLVVNFGYRESDLKKVRLRFHVPAVVGLALAFAGIPYYDNFLWICHIPCPPIGQSYLHNDAITLVPISVAIVLSAIAMFMVYIKVSRQTHTSNRWRFGSRGGANGKLARKVFWQAFFFVVALYGSWPILILAEYSGNNPRIFKLYWFWVLTLTLAPLQGFFNFFVYTRPKMMRYLKERRRLRRQEEEQQQQHDRPQDHAKWARVGLRISFPMSIRRSQNAALSSSKSRGQKSFTNVTIREESNSVPGNIDSQSGRETLPTEELPSVIQQGESADDYN